MAYPTPGEIAVLRKSIQRKMRDVVTGRMLDELFYLEDILDTESPHLDVSYRTDDNFTIAVLLVGDGIYVGATKRNPCDEDDSKRAKEIALFRAVGRPVNKVSCVGLVWPMQSFIYENMSNDTSVQTINPPE